MELFQFDLLAQAAARSQRRIEARREQRRSDQHGREEQNNPKDRSSIVHLFNIAMSEKSSMGPSARTQAFYGLPQIRTKGMLSFGSTAFILSFFSRGSGEIDGLPLLLVLSDQAVAKPRMIGAA